jgi:predicted DCC family thiol-disulfide oxidoreductase YuxK
VKPDRPVLFYDGNCRFCRAMARVTAALDRGRRLAYLPFSDALAEDLLAGVPEEQRFHSIHMAFPDGEVLSAGGALGEMARVLPLGDLLADAAARQPLETLFARGYELVADRRGVLSGWVPDVRGPLRRPGLT